MAHHDGDTKEALLQAAIEVFAEKGHRAATVRDICARAGANQAAVNYYFGGKDPLYRAVLDHLFVGCHDGKLEQAMTQMEGLSPEEKLYHYILGALYDVYLGTKEDAALQTIFVMEMAQPTEHMDGLIDQYITPEAELLGVIVRELIGPDAPDEMISLCGYTIWGTLMYQMTMKPIIKRLDLPRHELEKEPELLARQITTYALGGIAALKQDLASQGGKHV